MESTGDNIKKVEEGTCIKPSKDEIQSVIAKFECNSVLPGFNTGDKWLRFHAVYEENGVNKSFAEATPSGNIDMLISAGRPATDFFKQGKKYLVTFTPVSE